MFFVITFIGAFTCFAWVLLIGVPWRKRNGEGEMLLEAHFNSASHF